MKLIDKEALLSFEKMDADLCASRGEHHTAEAVIMMIKTAPTIDAVPVVRCKDCQHMEKSQYGRYCQEIDGKEYYLKLKEVSDGEHWSEVDGEE